jgi:hypothetical protein
MYYNNNFPDNIFTRSHCTPTFGTVLLGGFVFLLAIMIFFYPALIAYFIAAMILFMGLSVLFIGCKIWRFRNEIIKLDKAEDEPYYYRSLRTRRTRFTYFG